MKKYILPILAVLVILFFAFAIYTFSKENSHPSINPNVISSDIENKNFNTEEPKPNSETKSEIIEKSAAGGGKDSGNTGSVSGTQPSINNDSNLNKEFLSDMNKSECGFYFKDYGVCTGYCSEGKCISENRSCYCKIV